VRRFTLLGSRDPQAGAYGAPDPGRLRQAVRETTEERRVPIKDEEQQANGVVFRARDLLVHQRTQCVNALRGHLSEYGYVFAQGITHAATLIAHVEDPNCTLPDNAVLSRLAPFCCGANGANYADHATCMMRIAMRA
jgi:hypothetical protein